MEREDDSPSTTNGLIGAALGPRGSTPRASSEAASARAQAASGLGLSEIDAHHTPVHLGGTAESAVRLT